jgi:hypothetical protein
MRLLELLDELKEIGIGVVGNWEMRGRRVVILGNPQKYFPYPTGPQYPVDITQDRNPELTEQEASAIRRRFGVGES